MLSTSAGHLMSVVVAAVVSCVFCQCSLIRRWYLHSPNHCVSSRSSWE